MTLAKLAMNSTHWVVFLPHTLKVDHLFFSLFFFLIIMYDDIVVPSQTNELITRDTHRELVLETHPHAVGKICFFTINRDFFSVQETRLLSRHSLLEERVQHSWLPKAQTFLFFIFPQWWSSEDFLRFCLLESLCFDANMSHAGRQQA